MSIKLRNKAQEAVKGGSPWQRVQRSGEAFWGQLTKRVESRCGAVAVGSACLFPTLSYVGAQVADPLLRFHIPLIEPDVRISRIRLSDKIFMLSPTEGYGFFSAG